MSQLPPPPIGPPTVPPPGYYAPQPQWAPPKKRGSAFGAAFKGCFGVLAAIVVVVIIIAVLVSVGSKGNENSKVSGSAASAQPSGAVQTYKVGDTIKVGDGLLFTVTGVTSSRGSQFEKPSAGQYLTVAVSFQNNQGTSATVSSAISFELRDATGQSYNETILTTAPKPPDGEIAAHDRLAGALTYDVPKGSAYKLYFKNDLFAGGQVIVDLGAH